MLSEKEKHGIAELLGRMASSDLNSLAQTVTLKFVTPQTPSEAVTSIILHTDKASDLLKRRKVKKEFLFKYLHDKRVEGVEASSDKAIFIKHVLQLWESPELVASNVCGPRVGSLANSLTLASTSLPPVGNLDEDSMPEAPAPSRNTSYSSLCSLDLYNSSATGHHPPNLALILNRAHSNSSGNLQSSSLTSDDSNALKRTESNISFMEDSNDGLLLPGHHTVALGQPNSFSSITASSPLNGSVSHNITSQEVQAMADTFVKWYYELLNAHSTEFRPDHFFPDASAKICLQPNNRSQPPEYIHVQNSGKEVYSALCEIVLKYKLTYNPNLCRDGVTGTMDPHGLVIINACGTLHNASTCCGTFQQQFGLVRDPGEGNNWKIKFTNASLMSKAADEGDGACLESPHLSSAGSSSAMALS